MDLYHISQRVKSPPQQTHYCKYKSNQNNVEIFFLLQVKSEKEGEM